MIKYFRFPLHEILWEVSWTNCLMLSATIPSYKPDDKKSEEPEEAITVDELQNLI